MAQDIGLHKAWVQSSGHKRHYDISMSKRRQAVRKGAVEIPQIELGRLIRDCRKG